MVFHLASVVTVNLDWVTALFPAIPTTASGFAVIWHPDLF